MTLWLDDLKNESNYFFEFKNYCYNLEQIWNELIDVNNSIEGINCIKPDGAFYVFPSCKGLIGKKDKNGNKITNDADFVQSLLENNGVAVVQGSAFGLEGFFRISYATSMDKLKDAMKRIKSFCENLN